MQNEPRICRHSIIELVFALLLLALLGIGVLVWIIRNDNPFLIPFIIFSGIIFLSIFYSMTLKTIISEDEISSQNFLGTKTLRWGEISRVSGSGTAIKLHNSDGDVTVAPSDQLPNYTEVVEYIGAKRLDLFNPQEQDKMTKNLEYGLILPLIALFTIGIGIVMLLQMYADAGILAFFPLLVLLVVGIVVFGISFSAPQSVTVDGKKLLIKYFSRQTTVLADEVQSVELKYQQARNGKFYFVKLNLVGKKSVSLPGLKPSLPIVYLVLKNWHRKNTSIGLTTQQN
jgi:FtsH-binding integral membrane protein